MFHDAKNRRRRSRLEFSRKYLESRLTKTTLLAAIALSSFASATAEDVP